MNIQTTRQSNGHWSLVINGTVYIRDESYQVVCNVAGNLQGMCTGGECAEIAKSIKAAL